MVYRKTPEVSKTSGVSIIRPTLAKRSDPSINSGQVISHSDFQTLPYLRLRLRRVELTPNAPNKPLVNSRASVRPT